MKVLVDYIIRKHVPDRDNPSLTKYRGNIGISQGWISISANLFLFIIKLLFGYVSNSIALITDAFHTLSDLASSAVLIFGFKMSNKPADEEHPFGHGRAETIAALTISILIGFTGLEFIKSSISRLYSAVDINVSGVVIFVVIITVLLKEILARLSYNLGITINSDTLKADALHHRSDMWSSLLVLIAFVGVWLGYPKMDAFMALCVAAMMIYSAYDIARSAIDDLLGKPVDKETIDTIKSLAKGIEGVHSVHDILVHRYGAHRFISLHIEIAEGLSPEEMHNIADSVEKLLSDKMDADVVTHVDPVTLEGEEISFVKEIISRIITKFELKANIQDLRIVKNHKVESISFQIPVPMEFKGKDHFKRKCSEELRIKYPDCNIIIEYKFQVTMR
jgi:cation diffusion facilitator family transporter